PRALKLPLEVRIPPDVIDIDYNTGPGPERVAKRIGFGKSRDARHVCCAHRMYRLDAERHAGRPGSGEQLGKLVPRPQGCGFQIGVVRREAPRHAYNAGRSQLGGLLHESAVALALLQALGLLSRREHAAATIAADRHVVAFQPPTRLAQAELMHVIRPKP